MTKMNNIIVAHHDPDGICSARIIARAYNVDMVYFPTWWKFGLDDDIIKMLRNTHTDTLFVLDLGCDAEMMNILRMLTDVVDRIVVIDHHETDVNLSDYISPSIRIIHMTDSCTSALAYKYIGELADDWSLTLAVIGTYGDVADTLPGAQEILSEASERVPELLWNVVYKTEYGKEYGYTFAIEYVKYISAARRVAYNYGASIAYKSLIELERAGLDILSAPLEADGIKPLFDEAMYPNTALLKYWYKRWVDERKNIVPEALVNLGSFEVAIFNHPWDVGGWFASSRQIDSFAINYGVPSAEYASLSARGKGDVPLNEVMSYVEEISDGMISGGGHKQAVGGIVSRSLPRKQVIKILYTAYTFIYNKYKE